MKLSRSILLLVVLLLAGVAVAQTINAPIAGTVTLPDGTKVPFTGTGTLTLPQPPPPLPGLTVSPASVTAGGSVTVSWAGISGALANDWIALYPAAQEVPAGLPDAALDWKALPGTAAGQVTIPISASRPAGSYTARYFRNNSYIVAYRSLPFTVTGSAPLPVPLPPVPPAGLTLSSPSLTWGKVPLSATLIPHLRLLAVTNTRDAAAALSLTGPGAGGFALKTPANLSLLPQQTTMVAVSFRPQALGARSERLLLSTAAGTLTVPLTGEGVALPPPGPLPAAPRRAARRPGAGTIGPRGTLGADTPLTPGETAALTSRVRCTGFTAAAIQAACNQAASQHIPVVFLPAGTYLFEGSVKVPAGLTVLGEGTRTLLKGASLATEMFFADGDKVRFTRLKLLGAVTTWIDGSLVNTRGIEAWGKKDLRVDHCEISGFDMGVLCSQEATGMVDHCLISKQQVIGGGYGVCVQTGSWVMITDNRFGDNRCDISSNGDTKGLGTRPTHWEFTSNQHASLAPNNNQREAVDAHSGYDGSFLVAGNDFGAHPSTVVSIAAGQGMIEGNSFRDSLMAIWTRYLVNSGGSRLPHDVIVSGNSFAGVTTRYTVAPQAQNIVIEGALQGIRLPSAPGRKKPVAVRKKR